MIKNLEAIERYARKFERHLPGPPEERARNKAELVAHLSDAAEAGELAEALTRLGPPEVAATTFARAPQPRPAKQDRRILADVIDAIPLIVVTIGMAVPQFKGNDVATDTGQLRALGPGSVEASLRDLHSSPRPPALVATGGWKALRPASRRGVFDAYGGVMGR